MLEKENINFIENWKKSLYAMFIISNQLEILDCLFYTKANKLYESEYKANKCFWANIKFCLSKSVVIDLTNLCRDDTRDSKSREKAFSIIYWEKYFHNETRKHKIAKDQVKIKECNEIVSSIQELESTHKDLKDLRGKMAHNSFSNKLSKITFNELKEIYNKHRKLFERIVRYLNEKNIGIIFKQGEKVEDVGVECESVMSRLIKKKISA
jgi:hypothetical protein